MEATEDTFLRPRMIVLHELMGDTDGRITSSLVGLVKESAFVGETFRLDDDYALERSRSNPGQANRSVSASRNDPSATRV